MDTDSMCYSAILLSLAPAITSARTDKGTTPPLCRVKGEHEKSIKVQRKKA